VRALGQIGGEREKKRRGEGPFNFIGKQIRSWRRNGSYELQEMGKKGGGLSFYPFLKKAMEREEKKRSEWRSSKRIGRGKKHLISHHLKASVIESIREINVDSPRLGKKKGQEN